MTRVEPGREMPVQFSERAPRHGRRQTAARRKFPGPRKRRTRRPWTVRPPAPGNRPWCGRGHPSRLFLDGRAGRFPRERQSPVHVRSGKLSPAGRTRPGGKLRKEKGVRSNSCLYYASGTEIWQAPGASAPFVGADVGADRPIPRRLLLFFCPSFPTGGWRNWYTHMT